MVINRRLSNFRQKFIAIHTLKVFPHNIGQCPRMIPVCPGVALSIYNSSSYIYILENGIYNRPGYIYTRKWYI